MRRLGLTAAVGILVLGAARLHAAGPLWWSAAEGSTGAGAPGRALAHGTYSLFSLDAPFLEALLKQAPAESSERAKIAPLVLTLPFPDGRLVAFRIEAVADGTFKGQSVGGPAATARFGFTPRGFHATIASAGGNVVVEPWRPGDFAHYVAYPPRAAVVGGGSTVSIGDATPTPEGSTGTTDVGFTVSLVPASGGTVTVTANTADGTATLADNDYVQVLNQTITFSPGQTTQVLTASFVGDLNIEANETFNVVLSNPSGAVIGDGTGVGTIINDDFANPGSLGDLVHDSRENVPLPSQSGNPRPRVWTINQEPYHSYEVIVDGVTGDVAAGVLQLQRLASDGTTVMQNGGSVSGGSALSMRFKNSTGTPVGNQFVRVVSAGCVNCGLSDTVRVRAYDTTYRVSRYNNSATQVTLLVISNSIERPIQGTASFFRADGTHLADLAFTLSPRATLVTNTLSVPGLVGTSGSILVSSDAPFGAITGKAVAVEPATGFTFDTAMVPRQASTKMVPRDN